VWHERPVPGFFDNLTAPLREMGPPVEAKDLHL